MKFAHLSDVHLGGWREDSLRELGMQAFKESMDICIKENVGCIIISGDLFNVSLPSIEVLKEAANILNKVREHDINVYVIPGSHDYSASGKTMIDVLENSGLIINVARLDENKLIMFEDKTGIKIAGWHGRKGGLEKNEYWQVGKEHLEKEQGFKIFMFHTMLEEFKPEDLDIIECMSVNNLPKGFDYYAGGHPHYVMQGDYSKGKLTYPGALFPNNFKELERFKHGGFYIITLLEKALTENNEKITENKSSTLLESVNGKKSLEEKEKALMENKIDIKWQPVKTKEVESLQVDADNRTPKEAENEIIKLAKNIENKVVTLRIEGRLKEGKPSDIDWKRVDNAFSSAFHLLKNTSKLTSKELEEINIQGGSVEDIEKSFLEKISQKDRRYSIEFISELLHSLDKEKEDGETNNDFALRVVRDSAKAIRLEDD